MLSNTAETNPIRRQTAMMARAAFRPASLTRLSKRQQEDAALEASGNTSQSGRRTPTGKDRHPHGTPMNGKRSAMPVNIINNNVRGDRSYENRCNDVDALQSTYVFSIHQNRRMTLLLHCRRYAANNERQLHRRRHRHTYGETPSIHIMVAVVPDHTPRRPRSTQQR